MTVRTYGDISPAQAAFSAKELLKRAIPYMVLEQFGNLKPLPGNNTKTINFRRHVLPVPTDTAGNVLSEGVTPTSKVATMESYSLTLTQFGAVLATTDVVEDTHIDDVLREYMGLLGENAGQIIELLRWEAIRTAAGVNVILAGFQVTEADIDTALTKAEVRAAVRSLRSNHGRAITQVVSSSVNYGTKAVEPSFAMIAHTDLEGTIREIPGFKPVADYGSGASSLEGEFGAIENVRVCTSSLIGKRSSVGAAVADAPGLLSDDGANVNLYDVVIMGADAWVGVALKGKFAVHPTMVGATPSDSDPLGQRRKCGYKTMQGAMVTQAAHVKKIVCGALKEEAA